MDNKNTAALISGLMDNELGEFECHKAIQSLKDKENHKYWMRYHLIGDTMRHNLSQHVATSLLTKTFENEAKLKKQYQWSLSRLKPLLVTGMAAGIAGIAIYALNLMSPVNEGNYQLSRVSEKINPASVSQANDFNQVAHTATDQLSRYITNHNQYTKSGITVSITNVPVIQYEE